MANEMSSLLNGQQISIALVHDRTRIQLGGEEKRGVEAIILGV